MSENKATNTLENICSVQKPLEAYKYLNSSEIKLKIKLLSGTIYMWPVATILDSKNISIVTEGSVGQDCI